jgi:hypothetical protein
MEGSIGNNNNNNNNIEVGASTDMGWQLWCSILKASRIHGRSLH